MNPKFKIIYKKNGLASLVLYKKEFTHCRFIMSTGEFNPTKKIQENWLGWGRIAYEKLVTEGSRINELTLKKCILLVRNQNINRTIKKNAHSSNQFQLTFGDKWIKSSIHLNVNDCGGRIIDNVDDFRKWILQDLYDPEDITNEILQHGIIVKDEPRPHGVYFLIKGETVVYIGKSVDVESRIREHRKGISDLSKLFDYAIYFPFPIGDLELIERRLINHHLPEYNADSQTRKLKREKSKETGILYKNQHKNSPYD